MTRITLSLAAALALSTSAFAQEATRAIENVAGDVYRFQNNFHYALVVPTLVILAERDGTVDNDAVVAVFEANRRAGALWALAVEPRVPHHSLTPAHRALTVGWLRAAAELRLANSADQPLRAVADPSGWLGHPGVGIANWGDYPRDRTLASWFPSQATAEAWWAFAGQD